MDKGTPTRHESHRGREEPVAYVWACIRIVVVASKKVQCLFRLAFGQEWGVSKRTVSVGTV